MVTDRRALIQISPVGLAGIAPLRDGERLRIALLDPFLGFRLVQRLGQFGQFELFRLHRFSLLQPLARFRQIPFIQILLHERRPPAREPLPSRGEQRIVGNQGLQRFQTGQRRVAPVAPPFPFQRACQLIELRLESRDFHLAFQTLDGGPRFRFIATIGTALQVKLVSRSRIDSPGRRERPLVGLAFHVP